MTWRAPGPAPTEGRLERGVLSGIGLFRWAALGWVVIVVVVSRDDLRHPVGAIVAVGAALVWTALVWHLVRIDSPLPRRVPMAVAEVALGVALVAADGWVYGGPHSHSLGSAWPVAGVLLLGLVAGPAGGIAAGVAIGLGRYTGTLLDDLRPPSVLSLLSTGVTYALAGMVAGVAMQRLREAERQISAARAREEVARTLHDGVLQTLAVVQRRSTDPDLAALARDQERELRDYLAGTREDRPGGLLAQLREVATRHQRHHPVKVEIIAAEEPPTLPARVVEAAVGATREALNNAAKHGGAARIVVFVEVGDDDVFISAKDDGRGFDDGDRTDASSTSATGTSATGIERSIHARLAEVGGRAEIDGNPGHGTEVRLWIPRRP